MRMQFEGNNNGFPKQLTSYPEKSILGRYLRKRMGIYDANNQLDSRLITIQDFNNYGVHGVYLTYNSITANYSCFLNLNYSYIKIYHSQKHPHKPLLLKGL